MARTTARICWPEGVKLYCFDVVHRGPTDPRWNAVGCTFLAARPSVVVNPFVRLAKAAVSLRQGGKTRTPARREGADPSDPGMAGSLLSARLVGHSAAGRTGQGGVGEPAIGPGAT